MESSKRTPLAQVHESRHPVWITCNGWEIPAHYGDPRQEYNALQNRAVLIDLSHWTKINITGADRKSFIHGMVTNEVNALQPGEGNYSLFLSAKGKILADSFLSDWGTSLFLYGRETNRTPLFEGLNKYLILEDAELHDGTEQHALFSLQGKQASAFLHQIAPDAPLPQQCYHYTEATIQETPCKIYSSSHTFQKGFDLLLPLHQAESVWNALLNAGCIPAGWDTLEAARIEAAIPIPQNELNDTVIPQEALLNHAISFTKGCYIGQETVARLHFRGHVNRELTGFVFESSVLESDEVPQPVLPVKHEGKEVGKITSTVRSPALEKPIGLGFLRSALRQPGMKFNAVTHDQEISVTVQDLPFVS